MTKIYKLLFTPLSPFFFGDERTFGSSIKNVRYIRSSLDMPTQTTVFGTIRYLGLQHKRGDFQYIPREEKDNRDRVGGQSVKIRDLINKKIDFKKIKSISPVFIYEKKDERIYLPLPKDCKPFQRGNLQYSSIFEGAQTVATTEGDKYNPDYDRKKGITTGYISIDGNHIKKELIISETRVGNNRRADSSGFFKTIYKKFIKEKDKKYCFGVYLLCEEDLIDNFEEYVQMGAEKSLFGLEWEKIDSPKWVIKDEKSGNLSLGVNNLFQNHPQKDELVYFISPAYVQGDIVSESKGGVMTTATNRPISYKSGSKGYYNSLKPEDTLYRFIDAGSILFYEKHTKSEIVSNIQKQGLQQIGYNNIKYIKEDK